MTNLYLDTSCLLKLFLPEPESQRVAEIIAAESQVVVSQLAIVEAHIRFQRLRQEGSVNAAMTKRLRLQFEETLSSAPFERVELPSTIYSEAIGQTVGAKTRYCRTLDRLHLAAATSLGIQRFLTNDDNQARAAKALGLKPVMPRP